jgi:hypothetical protein
MDPRNWRRKGIEMTTKVSIFDRLRTAGKSEGIPAVLDLLAEEFQQTQRYHELFEVRKMQVRHGIGLPLLYADSADELSDAQRDTLEEGLLKACREVGQLLMDQGKIREGWMYLRPVGDRSTVAAQLRELEPTDDNLEELVEVLLHEAVDTARGYELVLHHFGTCNAITTFDTVLAQRSKAERQAAAGLLVEQVYRELLASLRADIARRQGAEPAESTIAELVADRDWLFGEFAYHLDTTHLASTVRSARILDDNEHLQLALDLTEYGRRLSPQFQYRGEEPFVDIYPTHALYFRALLGVHRDEAVEFFRERAQSVDVRQEGAAPIEIFVDLLARLGRYQDAISAAIELTPAQTPSYGIAPSLLELCELAGDYEPLVQYCREHENLLGFATGLLRASPNRRSGE